MDSNLLLSQHVENVVSKARSYLDLIKWIRRNFKSTTSCVTLYKSLVWSHLEYALVMWNRNREYTANSTEVIQRNFFPGWPKDSPYWIMMWRSRKLSVFRRTNTDLLIFYRVHLLGLSGLLMTIDLKVPYLHTSCKFHVSWWTCGIVESSCEINWS